MRLKPLWTWEERLMSQADKFYYKGLSNVYIAEASQAYAVILFIPHSEVLHFGCSSYDVQCANLKTRECNISHSLCYWHHWLSRKSMWVYDNPQDMPTVGCLLLRNNLWPPLWELDSVAERLHQLLHLLGSSEDLSSESYTQVASHAEFAAELFRFIGHIVCFLQAVNLLSWLFVSGQGPSGSFRVRSVPTSMSTRDCYHISIFDHKFDMPWS